MGTTWELEGQPATDISSQNLGALTMILGFFLLWIGTNANDFEYDSSLFIPIHLDYRAWFVFVAAFAVIIPGVTALDFAFDQGSEPIAYDEKERFMRLDGKTFENAFASVPYFSAEHLVAFLETPWIVVTGWAFFGLCAFLPFGGKFTAQKFFACFICVIIGTIYGLRILPAYWRGDLIQYRWWTYVYYAFMVFLFTTIGVDGEVPLICSMLGVIMLLLGEHISMLEKKKGKYWLHQAESNPRGTAFGCGNPLYVFGWLLLCMAMASPMRSN